MARRSFCEIGCAAGTDKCCSHKYHIPYETHLGGLRDQKFTLFEIGIWEGSSLRLWEEYFPLAKIAALDINPGCVRFASMRSSVYVGDQGNRTLLREIAEEQGGFDVVIDDGCHLGERQRISFLELFPHVRAGGYYVIEDLETSYYASHGGGPHGTAGTSVELVKTLLDDLNVGYHKSPLAAPAAVSQIHVYPNIAFIMRGGGH